MFHIQPTDDELANELVRQLDDLRWDSFRAAVAWARETGVTLLRDALELNRPGFPGGSNL